MKSTNTPDIHTNILFRMCFVIIIIIIIIIIMIIIIISRNLESLTAF